MFTVYECVKFFSLTENEEEIQELVQLKLFVKPTADTMTKD